MDNKRKSVSVESVEEEDTDPPMGLEYDWSTTLQRDIKDKSTLASTWLSKTVHGVLQAETQLPLPKKYSVYELTDKQADVVAVVLDTLQKWLNCKTKEDFAKFKPLRMTITGESDSEQTGTVKTLASILRQMFKNKYVIRLICPTANAAFEVEGETVHDCFEHNPGFGSNMTRMTELRLTDKFAGLLAVVMLQRNLINCDMLGMCAHRLQGCMFGGDMKSHHLGGLPILILVGDDYEVQHSSFPCAHESLQPSVFEHPHPCLTSRLRSLGKAVFLECAGTVLNLPTSRSDIAGQGVFQNILDNVRIGKATGSDVDRLMGLHLDNIKSLHGEQVVARIVDRAHHLFVMCTDAHKHNLDMVCKEASEEHPIARMKTKGHGPSGRPIQHHFLESNNTFSKPAIFCVGAIVALTGRNICLKIGLHNGAVGIVEEIVFEKGKNPNKGDWPLYIAVKFPRYCGPVWDGNSPKSVPIPTMQQTCDTFAKCCKRRVIPLRLAYASTLLSFQGVSTGPTLCNDKPNMFGCMVVDPGDKKLEARNPGALYSTLIRASSIGTNTGERSAIYFKGDNMKASRVRNQITEEGVELEDSARQQREQWVQKLTANTKKCPISVEQKTRLLKWAENTTLSDEEIISAIERYTNLSTSTIRI